jgi:hypothetical protein
MAGGFVLQIWSGWRVLARLGVVWRALALVERAGGKADALEYLVDGAIQPRESIARR